MFTSLQKELSQVAYVMTIFSGFFGPMAHCAKQIAKVGVLPTYVRIVICVRMDDAQVFRKFYMLFSKWKCLRANNIQDKPCSPLCNISTFQINVIRSTCIIYAWCVAAVSLPFSLFDSRTKFPRQSRLGNTQQMALID